MERQHTTAMEAQVLSRKEVCDFGLSVFLSRPLLVRHFPIIV